MTYNLPMTRLHALKHLSEEAHAIAKDHGFYDTTPDFGTLVALMHSELSEALEEHRAGRPMVYYVKKKTGPWWNRKTALKPEGVAVELVDCLIRILDIAGHLGIDLDVLVDEKMAYNASREHKHGKAY